MKFKKCIQHWGDLESIRREARAMDMKEDPLIKFVGTFDEDTIIITDRRGNYYEENKNTEIPKLDF
jgi:extradiol dioxygenase family protein